MEAMACFRVYVAPRRPGQELPSAPEVHDYLRFMLCDDSVLQPEDLPDFTSFKITKVELTTLELATRGVS